MVMYVAQNYHAKWYLRRQCVDHSLRFRVTVSGLHVSTSLQKQISSHSKLLLTYCQRGGTSNAVQWVGYCSTDWTVVKSKARPTNGFARIWFIQFKSIYGNAFYHQSTWPDLTHWSFSPTVSQLHSNLVLYSPIYQSSCIPFPKETSKLANTVSRYYYKRYTSSGLLCTYFFNVEIKFDVCPPTQIKY